MIRVAECQIRWLGTGRGWRNALCPSQGGGWESTPWSPDVQEVPSQTWAHADGPSRCCHSPIHPINLLAARDAQREAFDHIVLEVDKGYGTTYQPSIQTCLAKKGPAIPVFDGPKTLVAEDSPRRAVLPAQREQEDRQAP